MKKLQITLFLLFAIVITSYSQSEKTNTQEPETNEWKVLSDDVYEIKHPSNWEVDNTGQMGTSFLLFSPIASKEDQFRENVNLLIQDLSAYSLNLDQYVELSESQINTMITDGNIISTERIKEDKLEYQKVIYTGKQGIFNLKFEQIYYVIDNKAYVLTLTCESNQFEKYQATGEEILNSFELK